MASVHIIRRELLAIFMESPLYFKIPLRERLEFLKLFSEQSLTLAVGGDGGGGYQKNVLKMMN